MMTWRSAWLELNVYIIWNWCQECAINQMEKWVFENLWLNFNKKQSMWENAHCALFSMMMMIMREEENTDDMQSHYLQIKREAIFSLWQHLRLSTKITLNLCQTVLCLWHFTFSPSSLRLQAWHQSLISLCKTHFQNNFSFALKSRIKFVFLIFRCEVITRLAVCKIQQQQKCWKLTNFQTHNSKLYARAHTHKHIPLNRVGGNDFSSPSSAWVFRIK